MIQILREQFPNRRDNPRKDLNNPLTAVSGISKSSVLLGKKDRQTAVCGIQNLQVFSNKM